MRKFDQPEDGAYADSRCGGLHIVTRGGDDERRLVIAEVDWCLAGKSSHRRLVA
jgi:hypothetical protein